MNYKPKSLDSLAPVADVETLKRYIRKGIPLLPSQLEYLKKFGDAIPLSPTQRHDEASSKSIQAMKSPEGYEAHKMGYYTEIFNHFFDQAYQGNSRASPFPIPQQWIGMGKFRCERAGVISFA